MGKRVRLLEQLIKSRASVLHFSHRRRRLAFDGPARFKQLTFIANVLLRNALGDGLAALKPRARIKAHTVFARMQIAVTFGTLRIDSDSVDVDVDHCPA